MTDRPLLESVPTIQTIDLMAVLGDMRTAYVTQLPAPEVAARHLAAMFAVADHRRAGAVAVGAAH